MLLKWRQQQTLSHENLVLSIANARVGGQCSRWSTGLAVYPRLLQRLLQKKHVFDFYIHIWLFFYSFIFPERTSLQLHKGEMTSTENSIIIYSPHPSCHSRKHCCPSSVWVSQIMCEPSWRYICPQTAVSAQSNKTFTTPTCHNKIFNWLLKKIGLAASMLVKVADWGYKESRVRKLICLWINLIQYRVSCIY